MFLEGVKQASFTETLDIVQQLEQCDAESINRLFKYTARNVEEMKRIEQDATFAFKKELLDPNRFSAKLDKLNAVKRHSKRKQVKLSSY